MNKIFFKTSLEEFECMENICDEIILVTQYENYIYISKLRLWVKTFVEFFVVNGIDIEQLNLKPFRILEFFFANPSKKCNLKHLISNTGIIMSFKNQKNQYHMKEKEIL
jgi:hypothetical protein